MLQKSLLFMSETTVMHTLHTSTCSIRTYVHCPLGHTCIDWLMDGQKYWQIVQLIMAVDGYQKPYPIMHKQFDSRKCSINLPKNSWPYDHNKTIPGATQGDISMHSIPVKMEDTNCKKTNRRYCILKRKVEWDATDTQQLKTKRTKKLKFKELEHALGL